MLFQRSVSYLIYAIVLTIPLLFGAVHPIVLGSYVALMLAGCGGWLLLNQNRQNVRFPSFWLAVPLFLVVYIILQAVPLPLDWIDAISPYRAERVRMVNELAGTEQYFVTISDNGRVGVYRSFFLIAIIFYYLTLRRLLAVSKRFYSTLVLCLVGVGTFEALYGLLQFINPHLGILWLPINSRAAYGTVIYKNQYASLLNMLWPLAVGVGSRRCCGRPQGGHTVAAPNSGHPPPAARPE